jgi:hypothetical protein
MTREQLEKVVASLDETVAQEAVRQAREDGLTCEQFRQALGTHASGIPAEVLRRGYAAALMDEGVSGVTARQAQALHDALMADPELRWSYPQDGCHARGVLMVEAILQMGVSSMDIGKFYAFHRHGMVGGGWQVTTRDGQSVSFREHVAPMRRTRMDAPEGVAAKGLPHLLPGPAQAISHGRHHPRRLRGETAHGYAFRHGRLRCRRSR